MVNFGVKMYRFEQKLVHGRGKKRNTRNGGGKNRKKKLKIFKKSLKKSVDLLFALVLYYRCNQLRWFETNISTVARVH